jgi:uncharacterized protein
MRLTEEEKGMLDGAEGPAVTAAMDLLVRYGEALGAERLCDIRNVAGTMTQPSPAKVKLVREGGWPKAFAVINLDSDDDLEVPDMRVPTGAVEGEALVSHEPISGWGGIDPLRGVIIEPRHELFGQCFTGKILVFPRAKGSSGWSRFFQSTRLLGTAPIGMIFARVSTKSALGAVVTRVPAVTDLDRDPCAVIQTGDWVRIDADHGVVEVSPAPARERS